MDSSILPILLLKLWIPAGFVLLMRYLYKKSANKTASKVMVYVLGLFFTFYQPADIFASLLILMSGINTRNSIAIGQALGAVTYLYFNYRITKKVNDELKD